MLVEPGEGRRWAVRVRVSSALHWDYHLAEFDLLVQPQQKVADVLALISLPVEAVTIKVNGQRTELSCIVNDGDELEIAPSQVCKE